MIRASHSTKAVQSDEVHRFSMNLIRRKLRTDGRRVKKKVTWAQSYFDRSGEVVSFIVPKGLEQNIDTFG
jgi:hypothetical protein